MEMSLIQNRQETKKLKISYLYSMDKGEPHAAGEIVTTIKELHTIPIETIEEIRGMNIIVSWILGRK